MMKVPQNCPYCGDAMLTNYVDVTVNTILSQVCSLRLDHVIKIRSTCDDKTPNKLVDSLVIRIDMDNTFKPFTWAIWNFKEQTLVIAKSSYTFFQSKDSFKDALSIPFFDPDLSKYPKLVDKLRTYIVFT